jgi:hypothetical protein
VRELWVRVLAATMLGDPTQTAPRAPLASACRAAAAKHRQRSAEALCRKAGRRRPSRH